MEDRGGQNGVGAVTGRDREVLGAPGATGGDERDSDLLADGVDHLGVEAPRDAVGVHGVQKDLSGPELRSPDRPVHGVDTG